MERSIKHRILIERRRNGREARFADLTEGRICLPCYEETGTIKHRYQWHDTGLEVCDGCWRSIGRDDPVHRFKD
jgi:hypothetical protein